MGILGQYEYVRIREECFSQCSDSGTKVPFIIRLYSPLQPHFNHPYPAALEEKDQKPAF